MISFSRRLLLVLIFAAASGAEARVFILSQEKFASYLTFGYGLSSLSDTAFSEESSADSYSAEFKNNIGGEFGFVTVNGPVGFRFGFEILKPANVNESNAVSSGGATLYQVNRVLTGYVPKIGIDLNLHTAFNYRIFVYGTLGQAHVGIKNSYQALTVSPNADFENEMKGSAQSLVAGLGFEYAALDLTSVVLEVGYRNLKFEKLTYAEAHTGLNGAVAAGDQVMTVSGEKGSLDFSGMTVNLGARWWLF